MVRRGKHLDRVGTDCQAVISAGEFCGCSGYRVAHVKMDSAFLSASRAALQDVWFPSWTAKALCKSAELHDGGKGPQRPGQPFVELTDKDDLKDGGLATRLPERSLLFQIGRMCAPCPVRRECLHYAYEVVDSLSHHVDGDEDDDSAGRAYGIFGGVPGRLREHFRHDEEGANAWFEALRETKGWAEPEPVREENSA
jgi:hypothetical protein